MKLVWAVLAAVVIWQVEAGRIIGGDPTTIEEYPGIVQVESRSLFIWGQTCAANILNSRYVVSAAHCFWGVMFNINSRRIRAGTSYRNSGGVVINLVRRLNHPTYLSPARGLDGDISLIQLASPLTFSSSVQPVAVPPQGFDLPDGLPVVHAGWGDTVDGANLGSAQLQDVTIFTINHALCTERYATRPRPAIVTENMICAGILDVGGKDACQGDSGGPLYYENILIGIVSWGDVCASDTYPGVNTKVSSYTTWLIENAI